MTVLNGQLNISNGSAKNYVLAGKAVYGDCVFDWIDELKNREWVKNQKCLGT